MEVKLDNTAKEKLLIPIDKASGGFQRCLKRLQVILTLEHLF
ncbi:hypothetical protein ACULY9_001282 [Campylobacter upsaliensis]